MFDKTKASVNFSRPVSRVDLSTIIVFETLLRFLTYTAGDFILLQFTKHVLKKPILVDTTGHVQSILATNSLQHDSMPVSPWKKRLSFSIRAYPSLISVFFALHDCMPS